jgi:hypothetical protein
MERLWLLMVLFLYASLAMGQGLAISPGTKITLGGGVNVTLSDARLQNSGQVLADSSTLLILGHGADTASAIGGTGTTALYHVKVNKSANGARLQGDISIRHLLEMQAGNLNLNGKNIYLEGSISGETEASRVWGPLGGEIVMEVELNAPSSANPGNLGIEITSAANLGLTTIKRGHARPSSGSGYGIYRYFDLSPANNTALDATLVYHYRTAELGGISEFELDLWRKPSTGNWTAQGAVLDTAANTLTKTGIEAFSKWTAGSTLNNALPVALIFFEASCQENNTLLSWATASEANSHYFAIDQSENGLHWQEIAQIAAAGHSKAPLQYSHALESRGMQYYRLRQIDADAKEQVFPVVSASCGEAIAQWKVYPNPSSDILHIEGEGDAFALFSASGALLMQGEIQGARQTLNVSALPTGVYLLRLYTGKSAQTVRVLVH